MHCKDGLVGSNFVSVVRSQAYYALLIPEVSNNAILNYTRSNGFVIQNVADSVSYWTCSE